MIPNQINTRDDLQQYGVQLLKQDNYLLEWCTGIGKTRVPLLALDNNIKILWIHGDRTYYKNAPKDELLQLGLDLNIEYTTIQSIPIYIDQEFDCLVFDEAACITDNYLQYLKQIKFKKYIFLDAMVKYEKKVLLRQLCQFKIHQVKLNEAIEKGFLPSPEIRVIYLDLDDKDRKFTIVRRAKLKNQVTVDYPDRWVYWKDSTVGVSVKCTAKEYVENIKNDMDYFKKIGKSDIVKFKGAHLKMFLAEQKDDIIRKIIDSHRTTDRIVAFLGSINQCDRIAQDKPKIHSKQDNKTNQEQLNLYNTLEANELYNVGSLVRAVSLTSLDVGIVATLTNDTIEGYQKCGRLMRAKRPVIYFPIFKDTSEITKFNKLIETIKQPYTVVEVK